MTNTLKAEPPLQLPQDIKAVVNLALSEDLGGGDITALLISEGLQVSARIVCKENAILCGTAWAEATFDKVDPELHIEWKATEGSAIKAGQLIASIQGAARSILTGERTALNFLQTLSGTATISNYYAGLVAHTQARLLDTRKTLPGLRTAQKYAVRTGGCSNHRMGLFDAFLIKENHIASCGGIGEAISRARTFAKDKIIEVEIQNLEELQQALDAGADVIMLDNFKLQDIVSAVSLNNGRARLEASGGIDESMLVKIAETNVDYISIGALTKHCRAIDFTLLIDQA